MKRGCVPGPQPEPSRPRAGELHNRAGDEHGARNPGGVGGAAPRPPQPATAVAPGEQPPTRSGQGWTPGLSVSGAGARTTPEKQTHTRHHNKGGDAAAAPE